MYDIQDMYLDEKSGRSVFEKMQRDRERAIQDRLIGREIGKRLEQKINKIYADAGLSSPFKTVHDANILDINDI